MCRATLTGPLADDPVGAGDGVQHRQLDFVAQPRRPVATQGVGEQVGRSHDDDLVRVVLCDRLDR